MMTQNVNPIKQQKVSMFTETPVIPITKAFVNQIPQESKVGSWLQTLAFRAALGRAYTTFAEQYPQWVDSYFDEYFLRHVATPLLDRYLQPHPTPPTPAELRNTIAPMTTANTHAFIGKIIMNSTVRSAKIMP